MLSLCKAPRNLLRFDELKISFMTLTSDHTFFPLPELIALQNCKQQNNKLSLCFGGGEHLGTMKSMGRKISQNKKFFSREKQLELVGNLLKSPSLDDIYFCRLPRSTAFLNHQNCNITNVLEFLVLFHTNSHEICIDHIKSGMERENHQ